MFESWYVLDLGAKSLRLAANSGQDIIEDLSLLAFKKDEVIAYGKEAKEYVYEDHHQIQVRYPVLEGRIMYDISTMVKRKIKHHGLFRPCVIVGVCHDLTIEEKHKWQIQLMDASFRKVELVSTMEALCSSSSFVIHAGHSCCEMGLFIDEKEVAYKRIHFAGASIDEAIQKKMARLTNCLISYEDACLLKEQASRSFFDQTNEMLSCFGLDRYGHYKRVQIKAYSLWSCFQEVYDQIILWAKQIWSMRAKEAAVEIIGSGGLMESYGLKPMLEQALESSIFCTKVPKYDMIRALKGWT